MAKKKKTRPIRTLIKERRSLDHELGTAISRSVVASKPDGTQVTIPVQVGQSVVARMTKTGVTYGLSLNRLALPFQENGFYQLTLMQGDNGLIWMVFPTKPLWAFQIDLIIDDRVVMMGRHASTEGLPAGSIVEQASIQLT